MRLTAANFGPRNWARAEGQLLAINSNQALFSLLGTTYGGDGRTTFGLPDLRGRAPIGQGNGPGLSPRTWGQKGGAETHTLSVSQMPSHNHDVNVTNAIGDKGGPGSDFLAAGGDGHKAYHNGPANRTMDPAVISNVGGNQSFGILDPYLSMYWCISLVGVFPSRN
jgi:microcystin-dependent protein